MTKKDAAHIVGGVGRGSKTRCMTWGLQALATCVIGTILALDPDSVCARCYGRTGRYLFRVVREAQERRRRLAQLAISDSAFRETWFEAWRTLLHNVPYIRLLDCGDIFNEKLLDLFIRVAHDSQMTSFWMPTKEWGVAIKRIDQLPSNMCVRLSGYRMDIDSAPSCMPRCYTYADVLHPYAHACPGKCDPCRACWDRSVECVAYPEI